MNEFHIKEITATGPAVKPSSVDFKQGVNIIYGASNTGKTYIIKCIDYLFGGSTPPFEKDDTGYDIVSMTLEDSNKDTVRITRMIDDGDNGSAASKGVFVTSTLSDVDDGEYKIATKKKGAVTYADLLLELIGIPTGIEVIGTQDRKKKTISLRSFIHLFLLDFDAITTSKTIIENPKGFNSITFDINILSFLLTGKANDGFAEETEEVKKAKKGAVLRYINTVIGNYEDRRSLLEEKLSAMGDVNIDAKMQEIIGEIEQLDAQMMTVSNRSQKLTEEIYSTSAELEKEEVLKDRYAQLRTQYESDIERLSFIKEADSIDDGSYLDTCPFCAHAIEQPETRESYQMAVEAEAGKTAENLSQLKHVQDDTERRIRGLQSKLKNLRQELDDNSRLISADFKPRMKELKSTLDLYDEVNSLHRESQLLGGMLEGFYADADDTENENTSIAKYDAKESFDDNLFSLMSEEVGNALRDCGYPNFKSGRLSRKTFDIIVNGKQKKSQGQGYMTYLNTVYAFTLMKFLETNGTYAPRILIIDSPTLSLKENVDTPIDARMTTALFRHIIEKADNCQVIIAENEIPEGVDYSKAHMTYFSKKENEGRYGFLESVTDSLPETSASSSTGESDD